MFSTPRDFDRIFREHYARLVNLSYHVLQRQDLAEDVVQNVFVRLWNNRSKVKVTTSISGMLSKAVINESINVLSRERRHGDDVLVVEAESTSELTEDRFSQLRRAIQQLPERTRQVFMLHRYEGLTIREIAEYLDLSPKTIENQLGRALQLLRAALKK